MGEWKGTPTASLLKAWEEQRLERKVTDREQCFDCPMAILRHTSSISAPVNECMHDAKPLNKNRI